MTVINSLYKVVTKKYLKLPITGLLMAVLLFSVVQMAFVGRAEAAVAPYNVIRFGAGGNEAEYGAYVTALGHNYTNSGSSLPADLTPYDIIIGDMGFIVQALDRTKMKDFVNNGGGLFVTSENPILNGLNVQIVTTINELTGNSYGLGGFSNNPALNPAVGWFLNSNPNAITSIPFVGGGTFTGITGDNVWGVGPNAGESSAAAWDSIDMLSGFGRIIWFGDTNWIDEPGSQDVLENALEFFADAVAPSNPGGITADIELWLRADHSVFSDKSGANNQLPGVTAAIDGGAVRSWQDQSAQLTNSANDNNMGTPTYSTNSINFNPAIVFDGVDDGLNLYDEFIFSNNGGMTAYYVAELDDASRSGAIFREGGAGTNSISTYLQSTRVVYSFGTNSGSSTHAGGASAPIVGRSYVEFRVDGGTFVNGKSTQINPINVPSQLTFAEVDATSTPTSSNGPFTIGRNNTTSLSNAFTGKIAELILFSENKSATESDKIESYLALKYGITLDQALPSSYVASDGVTKMWNHTIPGALTHNNDIAGIGRDYTSDLDQRKSRSVNADSIITIEYVGAPDDKEFFSWGNDDGNADWTVTGAPIGYKVLDRKWQAFEDGPTSSDSDIGNLAFSVDVANANFNVPEQSPGNAYYLIYDKNSNGNLADECIRTAICAIPGGILELSNAGGNVWSRSSGLAADVVNLASGQQFSIAAISQSFVEFELAASSDPENLGGNLPRLLIKGVLDSDEILNITLSGTAINVGDYRLPSATTIFVPAGTYDGTAATALTIPNLLIVNDPVFETDETIIITITGSSATMVLSDVNGDSIIRGTHTYTILNDDARPPLAIEFLKASDTSSNETGTPVQAGFAMLVVAAGLLESSTTVQIDLLTTGTAIKGVDYTWATPVLVSIPAGTYDGTAATAIPVPALTITQDSIVEGTETVNAEIVNASIPSSLYEGDANGDSINQQSYTYNITDDDVVTVQFGSGSAASPENVGGNRPKIHVTGTITAPTTVTMAIAGTALSGTDYISPFTTINIPTGVYDGTAATAITIPGLAIIGDSTVEPDETIILTLSAATGDATLGAATTHTYTIINDDSVTVQFSSAAASDAENTGGNLPKIFITGTVVESTTVIVELDAASTTQINDHTFTSNQVLVTIPAGTYTGTDSTAITIPTLAITGDTLVEPDENVVLKLTSPTGDATLGALTTHTYTIINDDFAGINFSSAAAASPENTGANLPVILVAGNIATNSTVTLTVSGTATSGTDFTPPSSLVVNIPAGNYDGTTATGIALTGLAITGDTTVETDETIILTLSAATGDATLGAVATHTYTITNDDLVTVGFSSATASDAEDTGGNLPQLFIMGTVVNPTRVDVVTTGGTALSGTDVSFLSPKIVIIPAGTYDGTAATAIAIPGLSITADSAVEPDETVVFGISNYTGDASPGAITVHTYTILNDDSVAVSFSTAAASDAENIGGNLPILLVNGTVLSPTTVTIAITGTATFDVDFTVPTTPVITIPTGIYDGTPGTAIALTGLAITNDTAIESPETIIITLSNPTGDASLGAIFVHTYTIADDDSGALTISIEKISNGAENNSGTPTDVQFNVIIIGGGTNRTGSSITGDIAYTGTATSGTDYTTGLVNFAILDGASSAAIAIDIIEDATFEGDETVIATISNLSSGTVGTASASAIITDDDGAPGSITPTLSVQQQGTEAGPVSIIYKLVLSSANNTGSPITFTTALSSTDGAVAGSDYTDTSGVATMSIANGSDMATLTVPVLDDADIEATQNLKLTISNASDPAVGVLPANSSVDATITDNDTAGLTLIIAQSADGSENGGGAVTDMQFTISIAGTGANQTGSPITGTVAYTGTATASSDFTPAPTTFSIADGQSSVDITVAVLEDTDIEVVETVIATISAPSIGTISATEGSATANIADDDSGSLTLSIAKTEDGAENNDGTPTNAVFTVSIVGGANNGTGTAITGTVSYTGTATQGTDYATAPTTFSIATGSSSATITVAVTEDFVVEPTETIMATISAPSSGALATATATANLTDDDVAATATGVSIASNNADTTQATIGDELTLNFNTDVDAQNMVVTLSGLPATITGGPKAWVAKATVTATTAEGPVAVTINGESTTGTPIAEVTATTDGSAVSVDRSAPAIPAVPTGPTAPSIVGNPTVATGVCSDAPGGKVTITGAPAGGITPEPTILNIDATGNYSADITWTSAADGNTYELTFICTDIAGNPSPPRTVGPVTVDLAEVGVTINQAATQADPAATGTVRFTVVFSKPIDASTFTVGDISTVASTATGITVDSVTQTAPNDDTTFEVTITATGGGDIIATIPGGSVVDALTNQNGASTSTDNSVSYDTTPPAPPTITTGPTPGGTSTNGQLIEGACEVGGSVEIHTLPAGGLSPDPILATVDANGNYSAVLNWAATATGNTYVIEVHCTDASGNGPTVTKIEPGVVIDMGAPNPPSPNPITQGDQTVTGTAEPVTIITFNIFTCSNDPVIADASGSWSCSLPNPAPIRNDVVEVRATDQAGNVGDPATTTVAGAGDPIKAPTINPTNGDPVTGTGKPGNRIKVRDLGNNILCETIVTPTGTYSCSPVLPLPAAGIEIVVVECDAVTGQEGPKATTTVVSPGGSPLPPTLNPTDGDPITGTSEPGSTINIRDQNGNLICTTTVPASGNWNCVPSTIPGNGDKITATVTDTGGNQSGPATVIVDRQAPLPPTINPIAQGDPTVTGQAEPGTIVEIAGIVCINDPIMVSPSGNWQCDSPSPPPFKGDKVTVNVTDLAGNRSPTASTTVITPGDLPPPTLNPTDGKEVTGTGTPGNKITVKGSGGNTICETTIQADGKYNCGPLTPAPFPGQEIRVTQTAPDGTESVPAYTTIVDIATKPMPPKLNPTDGVMLVGTDGSNNTIVVTDSNGNEVCRTTSDANGNFSCVFIPTIEHGQTLTVIAIDPVSGSISSPSTITTRAVDTDGDGVANEVEDQATNNGDGNGDGVADYLQNNVISKPNEVTGFMVTMSVNPECSFTTGFAGTPESANTKQDFAFDYPHGLFEFEIICNSFGATADVTFYMDKVYNTPDWSWRKYNTTTQTYADLPVTFGVINVGLIGVTTANYQLTDGGEHDQDNVANGHILDPSGPAEALILPEAGVPAWYTPAFGAVIIGAAASTTARPRRRKDQLEAKT